MDFNLDQTLEQIKSHPLFLHLKIVIETNEGYHDHEDVYSHSTKTARIAMEQREGKFIIDTEALSAFKGFMEEKISGVKRRDIVVLSALLHDCGKILSYKEGDKVNTLIMQKPDGQDATICPAHEYWGGKLVAPKILSDVGISGELNGYISKMVGMHGALNEVNYFKARDSWPVEKLVSDIKSRAKGRYIEAMFNAYCDCFNATAFETGKRLITEAFNTPYLYIPREYFIP